MNCSDFQDQLFEFVEGSLSAEGMAAAERHLVGCRACREVVRQEKARIQELSLHFRRRTEGLTLSPGIRRDILAAARSKPTSSTLTQSFMGFWTRFAVPLGVGAAVLTIGIVLSLNHFPGRQKPGTETAPFSGRDLPAAVSVDFVTRVPSYQFRREGNAVIDTISVQTVAVNGTFHPFSEQ